MTTSVVNKIAGIMDSEPQTALYNSSTYPYYPSLTNFAGNPTVDVTVAASSGYFTPFRLPVDMTIAGIVVPITTLQAGKSFTGLLYTNSDDNLPGDLISVTNGHTLGAVSNVYKAFNTPIVSAGQVVWAGIWSDGTTAQLDAVDSSASILPAAMGMNISGGISTQFNYTNIIGTPYADGTAPELATGGLASIAVTDAMRFLVKVTP